MASGTVYVKSIVVSSVISFSVAVSDVSASASYTVPVAGVSVSNKTINASYFIVPNTVLPEQIANVNDDDVKAVTKTFVNSTDEDNEVVTTETDVKNIELAKADSVTMIESRVKVFTDFIDFDPSDDDIDATPVTISESDSKDITVGELADNDDVTVSESDVKATTKPGITASVSTSESINQFRPHKNVTDAATTSEAIDRFDVTTALTDTVSVTEATVKNITPAGKTDSVSAVQSNVKAFTSNIDFDLSDADVDPDPVTASEQINTFGVTKGLTDTASVVEATAKTVVNNSLADTASPAESAALTTTKPAVADSVSAVEGIKNQPNKNISTAVSGSKTFIVTVVSSGGNKFAIDGVTNPTLELLNGFTYTFDQSHISNQNHPLRFKDGSSSYTTGVTASGTAGNSGATVTFAVPTNAPASTLRYYCTVHGNAMGNTIAVPNTGLLNAVTMSESTVVNIQQIFGDTTSVTESIITQILLGESDFLYPNQIYAIDTDSNPSSIRGYHRGLGEAGSAFVHDQYRFRRTDFTGIIGHEDSLLNSVVVGEPTQDGEGKGERVGVIGSSGLINNARVNHDAISYGEITNAGLFVNFIYTDTDDTTLGGHYFNETPVCAGSHNI